MNLLSMYIILNYNILHIIIFSILSYIQQLKFKLLGERLTPNSSNSISILFTLNKTIK